MFSTNIKKLLTIVSYRSTLSLFFYKISVRLNVFYLIIIVNYVTIFIMENVNKDNKSLNNNEIYNNDGGTNLTDQTFVDYKNETDTKPSSSFFRNLLHILTVFGIGFLIFTFIFQICLRPITVVGRSMQPTLNIESTGSTDKVNCDVVYYKSAKTYNKNDIVIADSKNFLSNEGLIIKRVIATAGDLLEFKFSSNVETIRDIADNTYYYKCYYQIYLNGEQLIEDYLQEQDCYITFTTSATGNYNDNENFDFIKMIYNKFYVHNALGYIYISSHDNVISLTLEENQCFICGDNRNNSTDSRYFGAISTNDILGVVVLHIPYGYNLITYIWYKITSKNALFA